MGEVLTPTELLAAVRATGAEPYIGAGGAAKVRNKDRIPPELLEVSRRHLPEILALLQAEVDSIRAAFDDSFERYKFACRWFIAEPWRAANDLAYTRFESVSARCWDSFEALKALAPGSPFLSAAQKRLDELAIETDSWCESISVEVAASIAKRYTEDEVRQCQDPQ